MKISHNIPALQATHAVAFANRKVDQAMRNLSSGVRIQSAKDDASGMAISYKLRTQIRGLERSSRNALDGTSLVQTAEGAMHEIHAMLQRLKELSVQAANDTNMPEDRKKMQDEVKQLIQEVDAIAHRTEYNGIKVLNGDGMRLALPEIPNRAGFVTIPFVSNAMPAGTLNYDINDVGRPAELSFDINAFLSGGVVVTEQMITINTIPITFEVGDDFNAIQAKLQNVQDMFNADSKIEGNRIHFYSREFGSKMEFVFESNNPAAVASEDNTTGSDAVITLNSFEKNGITVAGFENSMTFTAEGNRVIVSSINNQTVYIDIDVRVDMTPGNDGRLLFANGDTAAISTYGAFTHIPITQTPPITPNIPFNAQLDVKDYGPLVVQLGANKNQQLELNITRVSASFLGLTHMNMQTRDGATEANRIVDRAIDKVSEIRSRMGAYQNRMEATVRSIDVAVQSTTEARSRIFDTDMAADTTEMTKNSVIAQAGMSILGQANMRPQQILTLMR
jgi:flagellin